MPRTSSRLVVILGLFIISTVATVHAICPQTSELISLISLATCGSEPTLEKTKECLALQICDPDFVGRVYNDCEKSAGDVLGSLPTCLLVMPAFACETSFKDMNAILCDGVATASPTTPAVTPSPTTPSPTPAGSLETCATYKNVLQDGSMGFCTGIVEYPYYLPPGKKQEDLEHEVGAHLNLQDAAKASFLTMLTPDCGATLKRVLCRHLFQECSYADPYFTDECENCVWNSAEDEAQCSDNGERKGAPCIQAPHAAEGRDSISWSDAHSAPDLPTVCAMYGRVWRDDLKTCAVAVPRPPCDDLCSGLHSKVQATAVCPLISVPVLGPINFFSLVGTLPACIGLSQGNNLIRGTLQRIRERIQALGESSPTCAAASCAALADFTSEACRTVESTPSVQASAYSTSWTDNEACEHILASTVNQQGERNEIMLTDVLNLFDNRTAARGGYYVAAWPGQPPLPQRYGHGLSWLPPKADPRDEFLNHPDGMCPLQSSYGSTQTVGYNSLECRNDQTLLGLTNVPAYVEPECVDAFREFMCLQTKLKLEAKTLCLNPDGCDDPAAVPWREMNASRIPFVVAVPRFVDRSVCINVNKKCSAFVSTLRITLKDTPELKLLNDALNCSATVPAVAPECSDADAQKIWGCDMPNAGLPLFPESTQVLFDPAQDPLFRSFLPATSGDLAIRTTTTKSSLNSPSSLPASYEPAECQCPLPTIPVEDGAQGMQPGFCCNYPCILPFYSDAEYDEMANAQQGYTTFGFFCGLLFLATFMMFKAKRKMYMIINFLICSLAIAFVFMVTSYIPRNEMFCRNPTQTKTQADGGFCLVQSITLVFFGMAGTAWWFCKAHDLFVRVYRERRISRNHYYRAYTIFAWGFPTFILITSLAYGTLGYSKPLLWCVFEIPDDTESWARIYYDWYIFFIPCILMLAAGAVMTILVMWKIYSTTSKVKSSSSSKSKRRWKLFRMERQAILFVFGFCFVYFWAVSFRTGEEVNRGLYTDGITAYTTCLLENFANGIANPASDPAADNSMLAFYGVANGTGCGELFPVGPSLARARLLQFTSFNQTFFLLSFFFVSFTSLWYKKLMGISTKSEPMSTRSGSEFSRSASQFSRNKSSTHINDRSASSFATSKSVSGGVELCDISPDVKLSRARAPRPGRVTKI